MHLTHSLTPKKSVHVTFVHASFPQATILFIILFIAIKYAHRISPAECRIHGKSRHYSGVSGSTASISSSTSMLHHGALTHGSPQVIDALCSFMSEETPSPAPANAASKVARRALFRDVVCPSKMKCEKLKSMIQHALAMFEEYHDDVRVETALLLALFFAALYSPSHAISGLGPVGTQG